MPGFHGLYPFPDSLPIKLAEVLAAPLGHASPGIFFAACNPGFWRFTHAAYLTHLLPGVEVRNLRPGGQVLCCLAIWVGRLRRGAYRSPKELRESIAHADRRRGGCALDLY